MPTNLQPVPMKIVFVNRFFYPDLSATSQMLSDAAFYLATRNHEVHIVTSRLSYEGEGDLPASETIHRVQIHRIWTSSFGRSTLLGRAFDYSTFYLVVFFRLLALLSVGDYVIAKTDPPLVSVPVSWAASIKKARMVNWLQDLFPEVATALGVNVPGFVLRFLTMLRDQNILSAEMNIAIGELMRERLLKLGVYTDRVSVIPNWADGDNIKPLSAENPLREPWGLQNQFIVGYSGNLGRAHEIQTLVGAIKSLAADNGITFLFIGGGALMDQLRDEVQGVGNCRFEPYQPREKLPYTLTLPDVHITILKPEMEGLIVPSKIYGVLAAGKPSIFIGDPTGELGQLVTEQGVGVAVPEGDDKALVAAIKTLQADVVAGK